MPVPVVALNWDAISAIAGAGSALLALAALLVAIHANRTASAAAKAAAELGELQFEAATRPVLISYGAPEAIEGDGAVRVSFTVHNGGEGAARIHAFGIRDSLDEGARRARNKPDGIWVPKDESQEFSLNVVDADHAWFRPRIRERREWVLYLTYSDAGGRRVATRAFEVGVGADGAWRIIKQADLDGE
jgi:hypothetical protein